jgi:hypothetical protein
MITAGTFEFLSTMSAGMMLKNGRKLTRLGATIERLPTMTAWLLQDKARTATHLCATIALWRTTGAGVVRKSPRVGRLLPTMPSAMLLERRRRPADVAAAMRVLLTIPSSIL